MSALPRQPRLFIIGYSSVARRELAGAFREQEFAVTHFGDGRLAAQAVERDCPDAILMDWGEQAGLDTQGFLRRFGGLVPITVYTAHDVLIDAVTSLRAGAADYLRSSCLFPELLARIERDLTSAARQRDIQLGAVRLTLSSGCAQIGADAIQLTDREARILAALLRCPAQPVSRPALLKAAGITRAQPAIVESYIKTLRKKHPLLREHIQTRYGRGYLFLD